MPSNYDILIDIRTQAEQVAQAAAAVSNLVKQATSGGAAMSAAMAQGAQAMGALTGSAQTAGAALATAGAQGQAAGGRIAVGMQHAQEQTSSFASAWERLAERLKEGITFGFGTELVQKGLELLAEIPKLFGEGVKSGVEFDKEMETLGVGLAGALRQAQPDKYLSFAAARTAAVAAIGQIQTKANALGLDFRAVGDTLKTSMVPLVEGGITDINKQIEVMTLLMQASASKGITGFQAMRDVMDILAGKAERVVLSRELGITNEDIKRAQQAGDLYGYLVTKLSAYQEVGVATSQTFAGLWQSVQNLIAQLEGTAALPIFEELKDDLAQLKMFLDSPDAAVWARTFAIELGAVPDEIRAIYAELQKVQKVLGVLEAIGNPLGALGDHFLESGSQKAQDALHATAQYAAQVDANQKIVLSLQEQVAAARNETQIEDARKAVTLAIAQAQEQVANSQGLQQRAAQNLLTMLQAVEQSIGRATSGTHDAAGAAGDVTHALAGSNAELDKMLDKLPAIIGELHAAADAAALAQKLAGAIGPAAKASVYQEQQATLLSKVNATAVEAGGLGGIMTSAGATAELERISANKLASTEQQATAAKLLGTLAHELLETETGISTQQRDQANQTEKLNAEEMKRRLTHAEMAATSKDELNLAEDKVKVFEREQSLVKEGEDPGKAHADALQDISDERKKAELEKQFNEQKKQGSKEAATAAKDERMEEAAGDKDRKTALDAIRDQLALLKSNPFMSDAQKIPLEIELLKKEQTQLLLNIRARQAYIDAHQGDPRFGQKVAQYQGENTQDEKTLVGSAQASQALTFGGDLTKQANELQNTWGTVSQSIAKSITTVIGTAVDGLSNAITGLITGTKNWKQALAEVGQSIIQMLVRIAVQQTLGRALIAAVNMAFGAEETAASDAQAQQALANWSGAAVAASIASYGIAAGVGLAAFTAAISSAAGIGAASGAVAGAFAEGGLIPGQPSHRDNRIAHVATGEYVVRTAAVQHYGADFFHSLNQMQVPSRMQAYASGGLVGDAGGGYTPLIAATVSAASPHVNVGGHSVTLIQTRDRSEMLQALQSSDGKRIVLGHVKGNRTKVGIGS